ncbi:hypothetical protein BGZ73_007232 [Actinomortierella ambigua]|nr:hypothetical protein BGZ73_007232 [Actinomortierella ambigua]
MPAPQATKPERRRFFSQPSCHPKVTALVDELFTPDWRKRRLEAYGYDHRVLPPERLSRTIIQQAMAILDGLNILWPMIEAEVIPKETVEQFSARFFALIPHTTNMASMDDRRHLVTATTLRRLHQVWASSPSSLLPLTSSAFGAADGQMPLLLDTMDKIQEKISLLRLLTSLERQQSLVLARQWALHQWRMHPIDWMIHQLNVSRLDYLEPTSATAKMIEQYTRGGAWWWYKGGGGGIEGPCPSSSSSVWWGLEVLSSFAVECRRSERGFFRHDYDKMHNTRLLWHGTRTENLPVTVVSAAAAAAAAVAAAAPVAL